MWAAAAQVVCCDYANIPGLHVVKGQVPGIAGSTPVDLLSN
jgi:hypothetical protein